MYLLIVGTTDGTYKVDILIGSFVTQTALICNKLFSLSIFDASASKYFWKKIDAIN